MAMVVEPIAFQTEQLARSTIGAAIEVHRTLGPGFLERVYHEALCHELTARGLSFESQKSIAVRYKDVEIGGQRVDLLVGERVLVELKAVSRLEPIHEAIVMSYLRTLGVRIGLLMNFHAPTLRDGLKRIVM